MLLASDRCCDLLVHSVDDVSFVSDDRPITQLDLLEEGPVSHPAIEGGTGGSPLISKRVKNPPMHSKKCEKS